MRGSRSPSSTQALDNQLCLHAATPPTATLPPVLAAQAEPRATDYIAAMVDTITRIINNGHAYVLEDGDVYFDVASLPGGARGTPCLGCSLHSTSTHALHCTTSCVRMTHAAAQHSCRAWASLPATSWCCGCGAPLSCSLTHHSTLLN